MPHRLRPARRAAGADRAGCDAARGRSAPAAVRRHRRVRPACRGAGGSARPQAAGAVVTLHHRPRAVGRKGAAQRRRAGGAEARDALPRRHDASGAVAGRRQSCGLFAPAEGPELRGGAACNAGPAGVHAAAGGADHDSKGAPESHRAPRLAGAQRGAAGAGGIAGTARARGVRLGGCRRRRARGRLPTACRSASAARSCSSACRPRRMRRLPRGSCVAVVRVLTGQASQRRACSWTAERRFSGARMLRSTKERLPEPLPPDGLASAGRAARGRGG